LHYCLYIQYTYIDESFEVYFSHLFRSEVQVCLVRNCWPELFVLGLAQCSRQIHIEELMVTVASSFQVHMVTVASSFQVDMVTVASSFQVDMVTVASSFQVDMVQSPPASR
jgi:hypothetical protein